MKNTNKKQKLFTIVAWILLTGILMWNTGIYQVMASDCAFHMEIKINSSEHYTAQGMAGNGNTLYLLKLEKYDDEASCRGYIVKVKNANTSSPQVVYCDNSNGIGIVHGNGMTYYNGYLYVASGGSADAVYRVQETESSTAGKVHYVKNTLTVNNLESNEDIRNIAHYSGNYFIICLSRSFSSATNSSTLKYGIGLLNGNTITIQKRFNVVATDTYTDVQDIEYYNGELWIILHDATTRSSHIHVAEIPTSYSAITGGQSYPVKKTININKNESGSYNSNTNELESVYINGTNYYTWSSIRGNSTYKEVFCRDTGFSNYTQKYKLDLNGYLGTNDSAENISGFGTADVYINGNCVANDVTDYCVGWKSGTTYEINDVKTASGKHYYGVTEGSLTGTITNNKSVRLHFGTMCTDGTQIVPNGTYVIASALNQNKVLDVEGAGTTNGTNLQLSTYSGISSQTFYVKYQGNGYYSITDNNSGLSLHAKSSGTTEDTNVVMWNSQTTTNGQWVIKSAGNGYYNFITHCSSMYLNVKDANTADGTNIQINTGNGNNSQKFALIPYNYEISYNANGGSGAPSAQTKIYKKNLTLSATVPQRVGYTFLGWAESSTATSAQYQAGSSYTKDEAAVLYAVWRANILTIKYNKNEGNIGENTGGFSATASGIIQKNGSDVMTRMTYVDPQGVSQYGLWNAASFSLSRAGYLFKGWSLSQDGSTTIFGEDDTTLQAETIYPGIKNGDTEIILYATWDELAPYEPANLPDNLEVIEEEAFTGTDLEVISIPEGCISIGVRAFADSLSLTELYIPGSVTSISADAFENCPNLTIYGPVGSLGIQMAQELNIPYELTE